MSLEEERKKQFLRKQRLLEADRIEKRKDYLKSLTARKEKQRARAQAIQRGIHNVHHGSIYNVNPYVTSPPSTTTPAPAPAPPADDSPSLDSNKVWKIVPDNSNYAKIDDNTDSIFTDCNKTDDHSVMFWMKTDSFTHTDFARYYLVSLRKPNSYHSMYDNWTYRIYLTDYYSDTPSAGNLTIYIAVGQTFSPYAGDGDYQWSHDTWHCVVYTFDGSNEQKYKLYVDGVLLGTSSASGGSDVTVDRQIEFNKNSTSDPTVSYDQMAWWSTVLDADAITQLYNEGTPWDISSNYGDYTNSGDLVALFKMNEWWSLLPYDYTGNSNVLLLKSDGSAWETRSPAADLATTPLITAASKYSAYLDGTDDYFRALDATTPELDLNYSTAFTIAGYIKINAQEYGTATLFSKALWYGGTQWSISISSSYGLYYIRFRLGDYIFSSSQKVGKDTSVDINDGLWHHLVITHVASGDSKIYLDSVLQATNSGGSDVALTCDVMVGAYARYSGAYGEWGGPVGELAVWNGAVLDADAVTTIYNDGIPMDLTADTGNYSSSSDLVAWWRMGNGNEAGTGNYVYNLASTGDGYNLTGYNGPLFQKLGPWAPDPDATGFSTEVVDTGGSGYGEITDTNSPLYDLDYTDSFSAMIWWKPDGSTSTDRRIFGRIDGNSLTSTAMQWGFHINYDSWENKLRAYVGTGYAETSFDRGALTSEWYCLLLTYSTSDSKVKFYINGEIVAQAASTSGSVVMAGSDTFRLGTINGQFDACAVWSSVLSGEEIWELYNAGDPINAMSDVGDYTSSADVVAWYKFEEGSGTTVADDSSNSYNMTLDSSTWASR